MARCIKEQLSWEYLLWSCNTKAYFKLYIIDDNDQEKEFMPPRSSAAYDKIHATRFGLTTENYQRIRRDQTFQSWKISKVAILPAGLQIRHENVHDNPVKLYETGECLSGIRTEQVITETIPFELLTDASGRLCLEISSFDDSGNLEGTHVISVLPKEIIIDTIDGEQYKYDRKFVLD